MLASAPSGPDPALQLCSLYGPTLALVLHLALMLSSSLTLQLDSGGVSSRLPVIFAI